jgi:hypothetical protein
MNSEKPERQNVKELPKRVLVTEIKNRPRQGKQMLPRAKKTRSRPHS